MIFYGLCVVTAHENQTDDDDRESNRAVKTVAMHLL